MLLHRDFLSYVLQLYCLVLNVSAVDKIQRYKITAARFVKVNPYNLVGKMAINKISALFKLY